LNQRKSHLSPNAARILASFLTFLFSLLAILIVFKNRGQISLLQDPPMQILSSVLLPVAISAVFLLLFLSRRFDQCLERFVAVTKRVPKYARIGTVILLLVLLGPILMTILSQIRWPTLLLVFILEILLVGAFCIVAWNPSPRNLQLFLALFASLTGLAAIEFSLFLFKGGPIGQFELLDYGDVVDFSSAYQWPFHEGGALKPGVTARVIGDSATGLVDWTTDSHGFRNTSEIKSKPSEGTYRILFIGDSFVVGYRVDQQEFIGSVLEDLMQEKVEGKFAALNIEVVNACIQSPGTGLVWLQEHGLTYSPDLVVLGVTLGNDIGSTCVELDPEGPYDVSIREDGLYSIKPPVARSPDMSAAERLGSVYLPAMAFRHDGLIGTLGGISDSILVKLQQTKLVANLRMLASDTDAPSAIHSSGGDTAFHVRAFDVIHGLGSFYIGNGIEEADLCMLRLGEVLQSTNTLLASEGVRLVVVIIPQRFQVNENEWNLTTSRYQLEPLSFDLDRPNRFIMQWCREHNINCLDLTPALQRSAANGASLYLLAGDQHWNSDGHRLAAELLSDYLIALYGR
jgi:hypothetical protein